MSNTEGNLLLSENQNLEATGQEIKKRRGRKPKQESAIEDDSQIIKQINLYISNKQASKMDMLKLFCGKSFGKALRKQVEEFIDEQYQRHKDEIKQRFMTFSD